MNILMIICVVLFGLNSLINIIKGKEIEGLLWFIAAWLMVIADKIG